MEYECGPLLLFSQDKIRMMDFLSDVFEFEVDSVNDCVQRGPYFFKLFDGEKKHDLPNHGHLDSLNNRTIFSFKVKSEQELKEIMSKYNFFLYRKFNSHEVSEKLDLIQEENKKILTIADIDQRLWRFEYDSRPEF